MRSIVVEAAVETLASALAARRAGADRLELCAGLFDGGTTPSAGLLTSVLECANVPVVVMVRPRGGNFVYSDDELMVMRRDIELARASGVAGIVSGVLHADHRVDVARTRRLVEAAGGLPVTFHRAFDLTPDPGEALEHLLDAGVSRVLTSGGAATALEGADRIVRLVSRAGGRLQVIAGGGIREDNVRSVIARSGVTEVHTGVSVTMGVDSWPRDSGIRLRKPPPRDEGAWTEIDEQGMRGLIELAKSGDS